MAAQSEEITRVCSHCDRQIPSSNIDLHYAHCSRNLEKCKICGDMIPKRQAEEHYAETHAPISCSLCSETIDREKLPSHRGENCPQRIVTCEFCEFPLPAVDLAEHQEVCGNRTELCLACRKYIRLRERYNHETRCPGLGGTEVEPTNGHVGPGPRRPPASAPEFSCKRLLITIAITGFAVFLGSFYFQRKSQSSQVR